jgi:REP element-mobilizing transposase RayT
MRDDFVGKHRSTSDLKAHLVLTTKYRRKVFDSAMIERLHDIYADLLGKWDCKLIEFNGEEEHVHLLFQYFPDIALNKLVNNRLEFLVLLDRRTRNPTRNPTSSSVYLGCLHVLLEVGFLPPTIVVSKEGE